jgi:putative oxidoreductase
MLKNMLSPFSERVYALLRLVSGSMFAFHGIQKLFGVLTTHQPPVGSQLWIGGIIELVAGTAIAVGFFTSEAAFLASGTMAVAYFQFHWKLQGGAQLLPAVNQGELALLYSWVFLLIACRGGGPWSVDSRRKSGSSTS